MPPPANRPPTAIEAQLQTSPRIVGARILGFGVFLLAVNAATVHWIHRFLPVSVIAGFSFLGVGLWMTAAGRPVRAKTGKPPLWWQTGALVLGLAGMGVGIAFSEWLDRV